MDSYSTVFPVSLKIKVWIEGGIQRQMRLSLAGVRWEACRDTSVWLKCRAAPAREQTVMSKPVSLANLQKRL